MIDSHWLAPETLSGWLIDLAFQSTLLLLVALLLMKCLRQPASRMLIGWGACVGLALLTIASLTPAWPRFRVITRELPMIKASAPLELHDITPYIPASATPMLDEEPSAETATTLDALPLTSAVEVTPEPTHPAPAVLSITNSVSIAWLCFAGTTSGWVLLGAWQARRMLRTALEAPLWAKQELARIVGQKKGPNLKGTDRLPSAAVVGAWRPCILLPQAHLNADQQAGTTAALRHEWAHVQHGDLWLLALSRLLLPVLGWHPLFWMLRKQIHSDQELLADAVAAGERPVEYAEALLAWAQVTDHAKPPVGLAALGMWEKPNQLSRRIEMVLSDKHAVRVRTSWLGRAVVLASLLCIVTGLSLCSLRSTVIAQEKPPFGLPTVPRANIEAPRALIAPPPVAAAERATPEAGVTLMIENMLGEVDHAKLKSAETSLGEIVQTAAHGRCRLEDNLLLATISTKEGEELVVQLQKHESLKVISRPSVLTLIGQEARILVGGEQPIAEVDETVNGKRETRIEYKRFGTQLQLLPRLQAAEGRLELALELCLEHSQPLEPKADSAARIPGFRTRTAKATITVKPGEVVILAEKAPGAGDATNSLIAILKPTLAEGPAPTPQSAPNQAALADLGLYLAQATRHDSQESMQRKLKEANAVVDRLQARLKAAREALRKAEGVDPKEIDTADDDALTDLLEKRGHKELAEEIRKDAERLKVHELGLFTEEYRRNYQSLSRQNEDLRKQLEALRHELQQIRSPYPSAPGTPPATPSQTLPKTTGSGRTVLANPPQQNKAVYTLQNSPADKLQETIEALKKAGHFPEGVQVIADARTNSLIP